MSDDQSVEAQESQATETSTQEKTAPAGPSRRVVLGGIAAIGGAGATAALFHDGFGNRYSQTSAHGTGTSDASYQPDETIYSMCMQCNTFCTIKVRLTDAGTTGATALARKISGNPYSPLTTQPIGPIPYSTSPIEAAKGTGTMASTSKSRVGGLTCLKGQAGPQIVHDIRRITKPLRRVGERGSGKWESISWEDAISQIVDGSPQIGTPGIKQWWAYAPEKPVLADWEKVKSGEMTKDAFKQTWGAKLIDPDRPDLGPRSNGFAVIGGDRMYLIGDRMTLQGFGSLNAFNHAGTCGISGVVANARTHPTSGFQRMYADIDACEYLLVWGTELLVANKGPTWLAPRISNARMRGMKMVVVDPRMSKTAEKADEWVPIRPGRDIELAFAIARWIVDNKRYDEKYLRCSGLKSATANGEPTYSDACYLVKVDDPKKGWLNIAEVGLASAPVPDPKTGKVSEVPPAVLVNGTVQSSADVSGLADLEVDQVISTPQGDVHVVSVFSLLKQRLAEKSIAEYAKAADVDLAIVEQIGREFTSHGKRAAVTSYRGPAMHANGFDTIRAIGYLNFLIGNHDWKGGHITGQKGYSPRAGRYQLDEIDKPNVPWGVPVTRQKSVYEKSSFFVADGYPAKRRWYQFPANLCHEVIPSAVAGYPYSLDALFLHRHSPMNSSPGGHRQAELLRDTKGIKLLVSFDIEMGDTTAMADFILPDQSYLERFTQESVYPNQQFAVTQLGQPSLRAFEGPRPVEWVYLEISKRLGLPGVGKNAFGAGKNFDTVEDYWLKMAANVAYAGKPVPDATPEEIDLFIRTRKKWLKDAFDEATWKAAVTPEEWKKVIYVLNRGGRFEGGDGQTGYEGNLLKYRYKGLCAFYDPKLAAANDPITGKPFDGLAKIREPLRADGSPFPNAGLPLQLVGWKSRTQGTHRTINSAWLRELQPTNPIYMSTKDAKDRGLSDGDEVTVKTDAAEATGIVHVTEGIRPGVVGLDAAFGHDGYGAKAYEVDGKTILPVSAYGDSQSRTMINPVHNESGFAGSRKTGISVNTLLSNDTLMGGGGVTDPIGGGAAQYDTWCEVSKA